MPFFCVASQPARAMDLLLKFSNVIVAMGVMSTDNSTPWNTEDGLLPFLVCGNHFLSDLNVNATSLPRVCMV